MKSVNMHEAKTHLSRLVEAAAKGESFIIAKAGKPMVRVVAIEESLPDENAKISERMRWLGGLKGKFTIPDDFDHFADEEIAEMFGLK
jgi:prevent-host-death family protein